MRCDKCGKRFDYWWTPSEFWPRYEITEQKGVTSHQSEIHLCAKCSKKFDEWLEREKENEID